MGEIVCYYATRTFLINNKTAINSSLAFMLVIESFLASCLNHFDYPLLEWLCFLHFNFTWLTTLKQYSVYSVYYYHTVDYIYLTLYDCFSLCQLTQLEKLNIGWNSLNTVPKVVSSLKSLKELYMWRCELSDLPERSVSHNTISVSESQSLTSLHACQ